jgi:hypothetical protein
MATMSEQQTRRERWKRAIQHLDGQDREGLQMRLWLDEDEERQEDLLDAKPSDTCSDDPAP